MYNPYQGAYGNPYQNPYAGMGFPPAQGVQGVQGAQFPQGAPGVSPSAVPPSGFPGMLPIEESYIENILRLNKGKLATVYMSFETNGEGYQKVFRGIIEAAGRDHIILSDPQTGMRYLLLMVYLDYVTFDEELEYEYPYAASQASPPVR